MHFLSPTKWASKFGNKPNIGDHACAFCFSANDEHHFRNVDVGHAYLPFCTVDEADRHEACECFYMFFDLEGGLRRGHQGKPDIMLCAPSRLNRKLLQDFIICTLALPFLIMRILVSILVNSVERS